MDCLRKKLSIYSPVRSVKNGRGFSDVFFVGGWGTIISIKMSRGHEFMINILGLKKHTKKFSFCTFFLSFEKYPNFEGQ